MSAPRSKNDLGSSPWHVGSYEPAALLGRGAGFVEVKPGLHVKFYAGIGGALVREE